MSGSPKFSILEKDGVEYEVGVEYVPESEDILYVKPGTTTIKDVLDGITSTPYSQYIIDTEDIVEVPAKRAMVLTNTFFVRGRLTVRGEVAIT